MGIRNAHTGDDTQTKVLREISRQMERLIKLVSKIPGVITTTTTTTV